MIKYLNKKFQRLLISKNVMKIFYWFHYINSGFNSKSLNISFENKKKRLEILQNIINLKKYKSYLEIGTFKNDLFSPIKCENKYGVDPVSGGNIRKTSDEFFQKNNDKFDLIFIDGLHHYKQVKKDIVNSLSALNDGGMILMHDCLPRNYFYQAIPRSQLNWNGDTWKAFLEFRTNINYDLYCCNADEGLGLILKRKNKNILKLQNKNFKNFNYNQFTLNYKEYLNLIEYDDLIKIIKDYE
jgi:predicted O-methyltransferase YrrM